MAYCNHKEETGILHVWSIDELIECSEIDTKPEFDNIQEVWKSFQRFYEGHTYFERTDGCMAELNPTELSFILRAAESIDKEIDEEYAEFLKEEAI
jgi:hypothetical protein